MRITTLKTTPPMITMAGMSSRKDLLITKVVSNTTTDPSTKTIENTTTRMATTESLESTTTTMVKEDLTPETTITTLKTRDPSTRIPRTLSKPNMSAKTKHPQ